MRIVLVLPGSGFRSSSPTSLAGAEHLGLGSIAAYLRQFGHAVEILNFQVEEAFLPAAQTPAAVAERILACAPGIVGMSITGLTIGHALDVAAEIKRRRPALHVCWGSHQAASCAEEILTNEPAVDTIVHGDGEITMLKLVEALEAGRPFAAVPGLWYRDGAPTLLAGRPAVQVRLSSPPPALDMDEIPFPARDTLEGLVRRNVKISDARIYTSRGCPFKCSFCVYPALGYTKQWRDRTPKAIVHEIKFLAGTYGISHFWFSDDNFTLPTHRGRRRALEIAQALIAEKLGITYRVLMRADAVDGEDGLLETLARSGLTCVYMGIESGSRRRLDYLQKHTDPDTYLRAMALVRRHRIGLQIGFIMFDPMTSWEDLQIDAAFLRDSQEMYLYTNYAQVLNVYPGTPVARQLIERGLLRKEFNYRSGYLEYAYEDSRIGGLAELLYRANTRERVELDDFFRRLRMIDVPALLRSGIGPIAEDIHGEVEATILRQNEKGYALFTDLLASYREQRGRDEAVRRVDAHYRDALRDMEDLVETLRAFPDSVTGGFSALRYLYTGTGSHTSLAQRAAVGLAGLDRADLHQRAPCCA